MPAAHYNIRPIDSRTFAIEERTPISQGLCYLLCGQEKALLIDTGFGFKRLKPTVESLTGLPVIVANTHAHIDHIGGNHLFDEIWFHEADKAVFALHTNPAYTSMLAQEGMPPLLRPLWGMFARRLLAIDAGGHYQFFDDTHVFHLGGRDVEVVPTPGHTPGSVCFLDRMSRMLFSGDTVCEWGILLHFPQESCKPAVFRDSMLRLKELWDSFDTVWPGHHGFPVEKSYIDEYLHCAGQIVSGEAALGLDKGRLCARYARVLITLPREASTHG